MAFSDAEEYIFPRPPPLDICAAWATLFTDPLLSVAKLKAAAVGPGLGRASEDGGVLLRSVYWRFYHGLLPPPTSLDLFPPALAAKRHTYDELRERFLVAPDGRWAADCSGGEGYGVSSPKPESSGSGGSGSAGGWDPLSLESESPWKTWFAHLELRATIRQDVDRTFPDIQYFTAERVRRALTTMLFLFSVTNPDVGYRQGMHELLAVCMMVVDRDSLDPNALPARPPTSPAMSAALVATLDRHYVEHDAFGLFQELMRPAKAFYEWRAEEGPPTRGLNAPQAPIIQRCNHIHSQLIRRIDPQLWERLETEGVEAQIWAIRWIRLILTRELPFTDALRLWDGIFAEDASLGILDFVIVAMLLLIRNELIEGDYSSMLTNLLHYPAPSVAYPFNSSLILAQAKYLRENISAAAGVGVVLQNQEHLGVRAAGGGERQSTDDDDVPSPGGWPFGRNTPPIRTASGRKIKGGLAAGLFERAQKAGLDKAFLSTVADLRSSLPDASSYLSSWQAPSRENSPAFSSIPTNTMSLPPRAPLQPQASGSSTASIKSVLDAERQVAEVRLAMVGMGKAMSEWLEVLRAGAGPDNVEALSGLDSVRDSLLGAAGGDVDDLVQRWAWNEVTSASRPSSTAPTPVHTTSIPNPPPRTSSITTPPMPVTASAPKTPRTPTSTSVEPDTPKATPKAPSPSTFAPSPIYPSQLSPTPGAFGSAHGASSSKPPIFLATRADKPAATLSRVPPRKAGTGQTPPTQAATLTRDAYPSNPLSPPAQSPSPPALPGGSNGDMPMDPLAGLGVSSSGMADRRDKRRSVINAAVGMDPLGVGS